MEKKNVPSGQKLRMVNFKEKSESATKDNEKWKTRCGCCQIKPQR